jgi:hypothetical protein
MLMTLSINLSDAEYAATRKFTKRSCDIAAIRPWDEWDSWAAYIKVGRTFLRVISCPSANL